MCTLVYSKYQTEANGQCFVGFILGNLSRHYILSFRITSPPLGQSEDSEVNLNIFGKHILNWQRAFMQYTAKLMHMFYGITIWPMRSHPNLIRWKQNRSPSIFTMVHISYGLTHLGQVTHICISKLTIIDSDNGSSPVLRQAIIWTNAGALFIGPPGTNFREILIKIFTFAFKEMYLKMSSGKW